MSNTAVRVSFETYMKIAPAVYAGTAAVSKAIHDSGLADDLAELVKIRASQINGCAFCLQHHLNAARKLGVDPVKLDLVAVWHDAGIFSPREAAALRWTEELTQLTHAAPSDAAWQELRTHFTEEEAVFLTAAVGLINNWNRIGASLRFVPPIPRQDKGGQ